MTYKLLKSYDEKKFYLQSTFFANFKTNNSNVTSLTFESIKIYS